MYFLDNSYSIQAYIKKRLSNSNLEAIINLTNLAIAPTTNQLLQKAQPTFAAVEQSFSLLSKLLRKDRNFDIKNTCCCITINNSGNCIVRCLSKNCRGSKMYKLYLAVFLRATSWLSSTAWLHIL